MSDPINANPTIVDVSSLPTRLSQQSGQQVGFKYSDKQHELVDKITSLSLLSLKNKASNGVVSSVVPELVSDVDMESSTDEELLEYDDDDEVEDDDNENIDEQEIFDLISSISDPEHPLTLAQLAVVNLPDISINNASSKQEISEILIKITPTITHCSLATLIGLGIRVRLERCLPSRYRIKILIKEGTHQSENQVNKQLNDKERVAAACENDQLLGVISQMLSSCK
ncbi:hypothetical protein DFJ63DRAFT_186258 [Scheffersomyces coipomensis]|uniref:uncharacterized protein n=1 Tax=Scheffersomyces coipomensis TaxID=1788519 RepID=UPI00315CA468